MTTPVIDDRMYALRLLQHNEAENTVTTIKFLADSGTFRVTISSGSLASSIDLDLSQVDGLISSLPKVRDWMASGEPAHP